jgi:hypothetical protein
MPGGMGRAGPICFACRNDGWASVIEKLEKGKNKNGWLSVYGPNSAWATRRKWKLCLNFLSSTFGFQTKD